MIQYRANEFGATAKPAAKTLTALALVTLFLAPVRGFCRAASVSDHTFCNSVLDQPALAWKNDELVEALRVHDKIYQNPTLPKQIDLAFRKDSLHQMYLRNLQLFEDPRYVNFGHLRDEMAHAKKGNRLSKNQMEEISTARSIVKQLRFAYRAFSDRHKFPKLINQLAVNLGHYRDATKNGDEEGAIKSAKGALKLLAPDRLAEVRAEAFDLIPSSGSSFRQFLASRLDFLNRKLKKTSITGKEYHEMRKVIGQLVAIFDTIGNVWPDDGADRVGPYLSTINGIMGAGHDDLVEDMYDGGSEKEYESKTFRLDDSLRDMLKIVVQTFESNLATAD